MLLFALHIGSLLFYFLHVTVGIDPLFIFVRCI